MLTQERHSEICRILDEKGAVTVTELKTLLGASESTIRRDLTDLAARGLVNKVFGGATALKTSAYASKDFEISVRRDQAREEKIRIARYAAQLIEPGDFIFLDAGTTTEVVIDYISCSDVKFVTNSTSHAQRLAERGFETYIIGGRLKPVTGAVVGTRAVEELGRYNFTKGFFGVNGIGVKEGLSTPDIVEGAVKRKAMERTRQCFVLADASKFNVRAPGCFGSLDDAEIITSSLRDTTYKNYTNITEVDLT